MSHVLGRRSRNRSGGPAAYPPASARGDGCFPGRSGRRESPPRERVRARQAPACLARNGAASAAQRGGAGAGLSSTRGGRGRRSVGARRASPPDVARFVLDGVRAIATGSIVRVCGTPRGCRLGIATRCGTAHGAPPAGPGAWSHRATPENDDRLMQALVSFGAPELVVERMPVIGLDTLRVVRVPPASSDKTRCAHRRSGSTTTCSTSSMSRSTPAS